MSATRSQVGYLVEKGGILVICNALQFSDYKIIDVTLNAIELLLEKGKEILVEDNMYENPFVVEIERIEGTTLLETLQDIDNDKINEKCVNILETYFKATPIDNSYTHQNPQNQIQNQNGNPFANDTHINSQPIFSF